MSAKAKVVVLTGAGISAESGLLTFRDAGGLWEGHKVEEVATPEAFARDPQLVLNFYNQRRAQLQQVSPVRCPEHHFGLADDSLWSKIARRNANHAALPRDSERAKHTRLDGPNTHPPPQGGPCFAPSGS